MEVQCTLPYAASVSRREERSELDRRGLTSDDGTTMSGHDVVRICPHAHLRWAFDASPGKHLAENHLYNARLSIAIPQDRPPRTLRRCTREGAADHGAHVQVVGVKFARGWPAMSFTAFGPGAVSTQIGLILFYFIFCFLSYPFVSFCFKFKIPFWLWISNLFQMYIIKSQPDMHLFFIYLLVLFF
jgi:hypothetical protein